MKSTRLGSVAALVLTCALSIACFVGPACGCSRLTTTPGSETPPGYTGAVDRVLAPCEPVMWDIDVPLEASTVLTVTPHTTVENDGEVEVTLSAGDRREVYVITIGVGIEESIEITVEPGDLLGVAFTSTAEVTLDWEFSLGEAETDAPLVTEIDPYDVDLPDACL